MEASAAQAELSGGPVDVIQHYLDIISTSVDLEELYSIDNLYKPIFDVDPPGTKSWEDFTQLVLMDIERDDDSTWSRIGSVAHLVRSMIQGNLNYPVEGFEDVIDRAKAAILVIDPNVTEELAESCLRSEVADVWEPFGLQTDQEYERAAAAYQLLSSPRAYKMARIKNGIVRKFVKASYN